MERNQLLGVPLKTGDRSQQIFEGFHRISIDERLARLQSFCSLTTSETDVLSGKTPFPLSIAENLIENVVGYFQLPMGIATYFEIDGIKKMIPMAVEETSIIAAVSSTAKWIQNNGGTIRTESRGNLIIGQVQIPTVQDGKRAVEILSARKAELIELSNRWVPGLVNRGGGVRDFEWRTLPRPDASGEMLVIHVLCDPCDAMGANLINQVCEGLKPIIEEFTGEKVGLCILSNLVDTKLTFAEVVIPHVDSQIAEGIQEASLFALADPYRATTHNKGVLNGIDPILIATGNDWRAVESGIHAYAARSGTYRPITLWKKVGSSLVGTIEVPLAVGIVGGVTALHPTARVALKILDVHHAEELSRICAAVGLVQNLGALKALSTVGIVKGHMRLHAANLAIAAGAEVHELAEVKQKLAEALELDKKINLTRAKEILKDLRQSSVSCAEAVLE